MSPRTPTGNRYARLLAHVFENNWSEGATIVEFTRDDLIHASKSMRIDVPKNVGDIMYSFRYRNELPNSIADKAPSGKAWLIKGVGRGKYAFVAAELGSTTIAPSLMLAETKLPNATPGIISTYALNDEQALLAILRYNRLLDIFLSITSYSLQSHLRTAVEGVQVETDEVYVGLDRRGAHFVIPVQAKGGNDRISTVQIAQDFDMCAVKFPTAICRPVAAQFMENDLIALFEFEQSDTGIVVLAERHYRLVPHENISADELAAYARR